MKTIIRLEEAAMFLLSIYLFTGLSMPWWWYVVFILTPDLSMLGYLANNKTGAICYNIVHHKAVAILIYISGLYLQNEILQFAGLILFGHSSMDRMMGYGLKYAEGFAFTHLGTIGKK
jgi:Domain of unknown function (DUF4260)